MEEVAVRFSGIYIYIKWYSHFLVIAACFKHPSPINISHYLIFPLYVILLAGVPIIWFSNYLVSHYLVLLLYGFFVVWFAENNINIPHILYRKQSPNHHSLLSQVVVCSCCCFCVCFIYYIYLFNKVLNLQKFVNSLSLFLFLNMITSY